MDIITPKRIDWIKANKPKIIVVALVMLTLSVSIFTYKQRPTFSAEHQLTGNAENRAYVIETKAVKGSTVTMHKDRTFLIEPVAPGDSRITTNKTVEQPVDEEGKALFKILPNELKSGTNKIHFGVRSPIGLSRNFYYTLEKEQLPASLRVNVTDNVINSENIKIFSIVTDPMNRITIEGLVDNFYTRTGKEDLNITEYQLLQRTIPDDAELPAEIQVPVNISVMNADGQTQTETLPVSVSTATSLQVEEPGETESDAVILKGKAPPGASINVSDIDTVVDETGSFVIRAPLPEYGPNAFNISAGRRGENTSTRTITVNRLMPKLKLSVDSIAGEQELAITGKVTPESYVTVNGTPALVEEDKYTWSYEIPPEASRKYTFTVKAEKEGFRSSEETITIDQRPVYRNS